MQTNNWEKNRLHYHYTHDANNSFGMVLEYEDDTNRQNLNGQWNHLFARSNTRTSQANLYLKSQLGIAKKRGRYAPNTEVGLAGDWETRKFSPVMPRLGGTQMASIMGHFTKKEE